MNKALLIGRLTRDPELRYTTSNIAVTTFTLAVNRPKRPDKEQESDFINIVVWNKQAENCSKYLLKGSQVAIEGRIQVRNYTDDSGKKHYVTEVVAENVQFLESKKVENTEKPLKQDNPYRDMSIKTEVQQQFEYTDDDLPF